MILAVASSLILAFQDAPRERFTLEQTAGRGDDRVRLTRSTSSWRWTEDGLHVTDGEALYARATGAPAGAEPEETPDPHVAAVEAELELGEDEASGLRVRDRSDDEATALLTRGNEVWVHGPGGARRLDAAADGELLDLAPDGSRVAFVRGNDLGWVDVATGAATFATSDGGPETFNGKLDWVYQEELYGRGDFKGFWWSPASTHIAFLRLDESPVHEFTVVDHVRADPRGVVEVTNYPKAGDPNPIVALCVVAVDTVEAVPVDLDAYADVEPLVVRVGWDPAGENVVYQVQDRIQTWLDLNVADPATGAARTLFRETTTAWVDVLGTPRWLADGGFLWLSERTGHRHVYRYGADGALQGAVTAGDWDAFSIDHLDEEAGRLWFTTNRDGATDEQVYAVDLDGSDLARVTSGAGSHDVSVGSDGWMIDRCSSLTDPPEVRVLRPDGEVAWRPELEAIADLDRFELSAWELTEIPARDGFPLDAALLKPAAFDPATPHPVWVDTYSGPDAPSVRNRWKSRGAAWHQFLAQNGIVVLQVNVRTASRKGHAVIAGCYKQLGIQELADLEDAVDWITEHAWADADRVGLTGWSYGGFMTGFALTHSDKFRLGIAGAGVYDWRYYDTIYTERFMQTPRLNPEGYVRTRVWEAAADLSGHLVLLHGTIDDNVHFQNTVKFVHALQKAGKSFDLMVYPRSRHGITDPDLRWHMRVLTWDAIREHLLGAAQ